MTASKHSTGDYRGVFLLPAAEMLVLLVKDKDSFCGLPVCIPRDILLTSLIFTFELMTLIAATKPKKLKAFN